MCLLKKLFIMNFKGNIWYYLHIISGIFLFASNSFFETTDSFIAFSFVVMLSGFGSFFGLIVKNKNRLIKNNKTTNLLMYIIIFDVLVCIILFFSISTIHLLKIAIVILLSLSALISVFIVFKTITSKN